MITNDELTRLIADARKGAKHPVDVDFVAEISRAHARDGIGCLEPFDVETLEDIAAADGYVKWWDSTPKWSNSDD